MLARLKDRRCTRGSRSESVDIIRIERGGGDPKNIVIAYCEWDPSLDGKNLAEVTRLRGMEPTVENAAEAAMWIVKKGGCQGIFHAIAEEDLERILRYRRP